MANSGAFQLAAVVGIVSVGAGVPAHAQSLPGVEQVRTKTIPIHRSEAAASGGGSASGRTPSVMTASSSNPKLTDVPPIKVRTIRISPRGEILGPADAAEDGWNRQ